MDDYGIKDLDFTEAAWESMYDAVDDTVFLEQDAKLIYNSLKNRLKFIPFGDYLKRYIYRKAGLTQEFQDVELREYQLIIRSAFSDNLTPPSFTPTSAKLSALSKNWLTQQTVKRKVVFLLGFGLGMSVEDVNLFLTKALREPEINPKNPFEVICWYCFKNRYNFLRFEKLWDRYNLAPASGFRPKALDVEHTVGVRETMYAIIDDDSLIRYVSGMKNSDNEFHISVTAKEHFDRLFDEARDLIAQMYNTSEGEAHSDAFNEYREKLIRNERMYDYEKRQKIENFGFSGKTFTREDITSADIEHVICAAIPTDRHGNLTPGKASKLNEQFAGKRFSRQRVNDILCGKSEINRFDLITLNFFVFSQKLSEYQDAKKRYAKFLDSTNEILGECSMGRMYVQNPYECFVLMCILSLDPLGTYADVWELSYDK